MHVFIKRLLFLLGIVLVLLLASFTYHRLALQRENASLNPVGQMVAVNGYKISVFVKGQGSQTLVFLSGAGTVSYTHLKISRVLDLFCAFLPYLIKWEIKIKLTAR